MPRTRPIAPILCLLVTALSVGCATVGKPFDVTHANDVKKGQHDKTQVQAWFGVPHQTTAPLANHPAGCVERWQWTHAKAVAGGSTQAQALIVDFDATGKVCDHAFSVVNQ